MDDLYKIGERVSQEENAAFGAGGGAAFGAGGGGQFDQAKLQELLGGNEQDLEAYLQQYEQMLEQGITPGAPQLNQIDAEGGVMVQPDPGFVIKTRNTNNGQKIFINVVSNHHVEAPHMKTIMEGEAAGEEGMRVPLSIGAPIEDFDKKQEPCTTYDLVANPETVDNANSEPQFRETLVQLCLASVAQKYSIPLDMKYKLPKMKYKGTTVQIQRIKVKKDSQIQEMGGSPGPNIEEYEPPVPRAKDGSQLCQPEFCVFYAREGADSNIDAFDRDWGEMAEGDEDLIYGLDLPSYRVNNFKQNFRGAMIKTKRSIVEPEKTAEEDEAAVAEKQTTAFLKGRTCVVQIKLPLLLPHLKATKQFGIEISDECLRLHFPQLPRQASSAYAPLTLWWPRPLWAVQAEAIWDSQLQMLTVRLPTEAPTADAAFDNDFLDAMF